LEVTDIVTISMVVSNGLYAEYLTTRHGNPCQFGAGISPANIYFE